MPTIKAGPSVNDGHEIKYFKRHRQDDPAQAEPGREFLRSMDDNVRGKFRATLVAVAAAPPHKFAGGGRWEAMHGDMTGWYEARCNGRDRTQHRLFCLIDLDAKGAVKPWLVVVAGMTKAWQAKFTEAEYQNIRALGEEYRARKPRSVS